MRSPFFVSNTSVSPSNTAVTMLIQSSRVGSSGSATPAMIAASKMSASPALIGRIQTMNFVRLSKTARPSSTAASIEAKLSSVKAMSAASFVTLVPVMSPSPRPFRPV